MTFRLPRTVLVTLERGEVASRWSVTSAAGKSSPLLIFA